MSDCETMDSTEPQQQTNGSQQNHEPNVAESAGNALKKEEPIQPGNTAQPATNGAMDGQQAKEEAKEEKMDASSVKSDQQQVFLENLQKPKLLPKN